MEVVPRDLTGPSTCGLIAQELNSVQNGGYWDDAKKAGSKAREDDMPHAGKHTLVR